MKRAAPLRLVTPMKKSPMPADVAIGARIRLRRIEIGMSQEKLAEAIGLTFQQVQKYEKGTNRVGGSRIAALAEVLSVPPSYFFGSVEQAGAAGLEPLLTSREGLELARAFIAIDDPQKRRLLVRMAEAIAGIPLNTAMSA